MAKKKAKALVLFSGGLDSRLAIKILQDQKIEVEAVTFLLPFGGGCCSNEICTLKFTQLEGVKHHLVECRKGEKFREFLEVVKKPKHGYGKGMNPCIDCRIFMLKHAKKLKEKIKADFIATGEVLNERPMSQYKKALFLIEKEVGLEGDILRPLSAKLLPLTNPEKKGLVNREELLAIKGRRRKEQIELAKKYRFLYPPPAGGCLLCEKEYAAKLKDLFEHKKIKEITPEEIQTLNKGRHFRVKGKIILGRNKKENEFLENLNKALRWNILIPKKPGPSAIFEKEEDKDIVKKLIEAYSSKDSKKRKKFEKYRICFKD